MHLNIEQILWALVLAAHLILLIVLIGRERSSRFPWFTAAIALSTVRLIVDHLLHGKLTTIAFYWQSYTAMALDALLGLLVLIELTRKVFASGKAGIILKPAHWTGATLVTFAIATGAVWAWGPWPAWKAISAEPAQLPILLLVLSATKAQLFMAILTVEVAILMRVFGSRFGFRWKSQPQQIILGLSTYALGFLTVQGITDSIKRTVHLTSRDQYDHIVRLFTNLDNARFVLWLLVLLWWIFWLWRDEPGLTATLATPETPVLAGPPPPQTDIPEGDQEGDPDFRD